MTKQFYVTTPIYYVNDKPHIGHAYTTVAADVLARYYRSGHTPVYFLTGVDEHGQKVEKAAKALGIAPQTHCDEMSVRFRKLWERLRIEPSAFIRTTDEGHKKVVADALTALHKKGLIVQRDFEGWYCTPCERYWTAKDITDNECPDCHRPVEVLKEKNYFFLMSRYASQIQKAIETDELEILPRSRKNEVLGFIAGGVGDLCISRPRQRLAWGIPLPFDEDYVTYVWFDALMNYVSGPQYLSGGDDIWPADVHLIGKDILTTHAVYWPAMLMALELPLPRRIVAHGWWNFSGEKMSKSVGNVVDPEELIDQYSLDSLDSSISERTAVDAFRYFLLSEVNFGLDGTFSLDAFERRWTADLSNDIGNLLSRVTALVIKLLGGSVISSPQDDDRALIKTCANAIESVQFSHATEAIVGHARTLNQFLQEKKPWSDLATAKDTLARAVAGLRAICSVLAPFMPDSADEMAKRLGLEKASSSQRLDHACDVYTAVVEAGEPLFKRPERRQTGDETPVLVTSSTPPAPAQKIIAGANNYSPVPTPSGPCSIDDVKKLGLRVGVVISAERVEKTKKLLKLFVDIGSEQRTVVAGIAETYTPEELVGKQVVVVANLAPAVIRGIESRGMILAASDGKTLSLVAPLADIPAGFEVR